MINKKNNFLNDKISIIITTLNEERNLPYVLNGLPKVYEVIVVDGYSRDKTVEIVKEFGAKVLYDNVGKGSALRKGLNAASGDIVIMMDADCSHTSNELNLLIGGINAGYDVCMGSRFIQGGGTADMPFYRKFGNKIFVSLINLFWGTRYTDLCYGYRAFRREIIKDLNLESNGFGIETEISIKAKKNNLRIVEVPSFEKSRLYGLGKLRTFRDGWIIFKRIIRELFRK